MIQQKKKHSFKTHPQRLAVDFPVGSGVRLIGEVAGSGVGYRLSALGGRGFIAGWFGVGMFRGL